MSITLFPHQIEQVELGKKGKNINQSEVGVRQNPSRTYLIQRK